MQFQQIVFAFFVGFAAVLLVNAQVPPRLSIPGAIPVGGPVVPLRPQFRNERVIRVRRPTALRSQSPLLSSVTPRLLDEPKPVTESPEEDGPDAFLPTLLREQQIHQAQQAQFHQTAAAFFNEPNSIQDSPSLPSFIQHQEEPQPEQQIIPSPPRFPERPSQVPSARPPPSYGIGSGSQRFGLERPQPAPQPVQPQRVNVVRSRPAQREPRPQFKAQVSAGPTQNQLHEDREVQPRRQRPVAQTIRKWNEENEDGSITWGYENDDGSFKEEIIGTDCLTRGTYGYVDPDGNKREYHYETGIKCDPNTRQTEEELQENGFINYEENKAVLPNGIEIDMNQLGKKKSKRPNAIYRN